MTGLGSGVGAVLLVLLLGGSMVAGGSIALRALLHHDSPGAGSQGGQGGGSVEPTPSASAGPSTTSTTSTTPAGAVLPDWTTGEWSGEVYQPTGKITSYAVQISLQAGQAQGRIEMPELGCAGALTVESATKLTVIVKTRLEDDAWGRCVGQSTLQLTRDGSDQLLYAWKDDAQAGNDAGGTVTRQ